MGVFQTAIQFLKGVLTNSAPLPSQDYITGMLFYNNSVPALFPDSGIVNCYSLQDAINAGLDCKHEDETAATGTYTFTHIGNAGDTISFYAQEPTPQGVVAVPSLIGSYICKSTDSTVTLLAASVKAAINANTANNGGYTATNLAGVLTITARPGLGIGLNTGSPLSVVITGGTITGTIAQFSGGVGSKWDLYYYHVAEYFRMNPNGNCWLSVQPIPGSYTFSEVQALQTTAKGVIRQIGVYVDAHAFTTADVTALNTICNTLDGLNMPLSAILAPDVSGYTGSTGMGAAPDLSGLNCEWVSVNVSQDGAAYGFYLFSAYGKSVSNLGALMGCISVAPVSQDIANPTSPYNIEGGAYPFKVVAPNGNNTANLPAENSTPAFGNNQLYTTVAQSSVLTQLDNYRYIYTGQYIGYNGTYFSEENCCTLTNSNYAYISQNRVEAKIERLFYLAYLPYNKSGLQLNADGTIFAPLIASLQSVGNNTLTTNMVNEGELSAVSTIISPTQNVTNAGKLVITLYEVNNPIARKIEIVVNSVQSIP